MNSIAATRAMYLLLFLWTSIASAQELTLVDRVEGVSRIWMEAHYNFAYFDQVPDLNWDEQYRITLDRVATLQDDYLYYRELERFMAKLHDGHSNVFLPAQMQKSLGVSPLRVAPINGEPVVHRVAASLANTIPVGSVITAINGLQTKAYVDDHVQPFICASSPQQLHNVSFGDQLIAGRAGDRFAIKLRTPKGDTRNVEFTLLAQDEPVEFHPAANNTNPYEFKMLDDGIAYLRIDTFGDGPALEAAVGPQLGQFLSARGIIIDLRRNGGGNTSVGAFIAGLLTDHPLKGSAWRTREHRAADLAWSAFAKQGTDKYNYFQQRGDWHIEPATDWPAHPTYRTQAPVVVLTDWRTASAAEDFLIIVDELEQVTTVGRATYGSSGQPLAFPLPGGGTARICTKRDTYPDGRDFVGIGITPDIEMPLTLEELTGAKDLTLERGLEILRKRVGEQ